MFSSVHDMFRFFHGRRVSWICRPLNIFGITSIGDLLVPLVRHKSTTELWSQIEATGNAIPQYEIHDPMAGRVRALVARDGCVKY